MEETRLKAYIPYSYPKWGMDIQEMPHPSSNVAGCPSKGSFHPQMTEFPAYQKVAILCNICNIYGKLSKLTNVKYQLIVQCFPSQTKMYVDVVVRCCEITYTNHYPDI